MSSWFYKFLLTTNVIGVWMTIFFGAVLSNPLSDQIEQCGGSGSACAIKSESQLEEQFRGDNGGLQNLYVKKLIVGKETAYAGSFTNIFNHCVEDLVMGFDSERFPQYMINSTCKEDPTCSTTTDILFVRKLDTSACDNKGWQKYDEQPPVFLTVCRESN